jgi:glycosyltransferase involved in cell wall biosynthesis
VTQHVERNNPLSLTSLLTRKLRSAAWHARNLQERRKQRAVDLQNRNLCRRWLHGIRTETPDVLIGANFVPYGGTRQHMHSICRFSALQVRLVPANEILERISAGQFVNIVAGDFNSLQFNSRPVLHSHVFPWYIHWCWRKKQEFNLRWVHTHHNWYHPEFARGELLPWQREFNEGFLFALRHADVSISVSRWQQRFLKSSFGLETLYLPNGVDVSACLAGDAAKGRQRVQEQDFVLYVGRNDPVKNPADFARLATAMPGTRFVMLGQDLSADCLQSEWGVECPSNLRVLGGVSHAEVQDVLAACTVLVMTSLREGLPTLALEAMAHGKPVVVPSEDGCMEAVGDGEFGLVYLQGSIHSLAAQVERALNDCSHCDAARERVLREYDWPQVTRVLDQIYNRRLPC